MLSGIKNNSVGVLECLKTMTILYYYYEISIYSQRRLYCLEASLQ